ncbi:MAG: SDR family oxidoreductase [Ilumatobacter fluminis]|uniref:SDR family oxidoreductase n=1 Tax=Ilumatobacter fluminis TaxID=467091 RepID=UPI0032EF785A
MDLGLKDRRAIVLGSSSGLGHATAATLVAEGARVVVTSRDADRAEHARRQCGAEAALAGDMTEPGATESLVDNAAERLGGLDIVVLNTGGGGAGSLLDKSAADDDAAYRSMLRPILEGARAAARHLRLSDQARLVVLTARSVAEATTDLALSSVFRSGAAAAARSLALDLAPHVNVNVVVTGQFDTGALERFEHARARAEGRDVHEVRAEHIEAIPLGRVGRADELADVVTFLCSARSSFVTGSAIRVDGGAIRSF